MNERRRESMRRLVSIFMALAMLAVLSSGCGGVSKEAKVKCPKCGAIFTLNEGLDELQRTGGGGD